MYFVAGTFVQCEMTTGHDEDIPFYIPVYAIATVIDPTFGFRWLADLSGDQQDHDALQRKFQDLIIQESKSRGSMFYVITLRL